MSNFQFLESHWTDLAKLGDLSEKYVYSDPRYINSSMARGQLFAKAKSSSGIHNINSKELGSIRIDVPTIEEQTEILKIIEPLIKKELDVKDITSHMIENIAELKKSILAKAFRGELGTNVSLEESSIELLKKTIEEG